jgi:hypothetical protein
VANSTIVVQVFLLGLILLVCVSGYLYLATNDACLRDVAHAQYHHRCNGTSCMQPVGPPLRGNDAADCSALEARR